MQSVRYGAIVSARKSLLFFCGVVLLFFAASWFITSTAIECGFDKNYTSKRVVINEQIVWAAIADSPQLRDKGLSNKTCLAGNEGMLFVYDQPTTPAFWMKDMQFSIDIVWLRSDKTVVSVRNNVQPESFPTTFSPSENILFVLELPAGRAKALGIMPNVQLAW